MGLIRAPGWRRGGLLAGIAVAAGLVAMLWASPQILVLLREGYPPRLFDPAGRYAAVVGGTAEIERGVLRPPSPRLAELFAASGGDAMLVVEGGKLSVEHYANGHDAASRFNSYSLVKSLVGVLVLKAVAEGRIQGLDQPIGELLPASREGGAGQVTVRQALDMVSGIDFEASVAKQMSGVGDKPFEAFPYNPFGPLAKLHALGLEAVLPGLRVAPDEVGAFSYQNVNTALLGAVLEQVYGVPLSDLLSEKLWKPAGAADASWRVYPASGKPTPYCCLFATAADWALVGRYLSRNGTTAEPFLPMELWQYWIGEDIPDSARADGTYRTLMR